MPRRSRTNRTVVVVIEDPRSGSFVDELEELAAAYDYKILFVTSASAGDDQIGLPEAVYSLQKASQ